MDDFKNLHSVDTKLLSDAAVAFLALGDQAPPEGHGTMLAIIFNNGMAYLNFKNYLAWQLSRNKRSP